MKLKYLPANDKANLRILRHTNDTDEIKRILLDVLSHEFTFQTLWEYHKWFYKLNQKDYDESVGLRLALMIIKFFEGNLAEAYDLLLSLPEDSYERIYGTLVFPTTTFEDKLKCVEKIKEFGYFEKSNITITAGRPSVLCGVWDFSELSSILLTDKPYVEDIFDTLFHSKGAYITEVLLAEVLYQRDECYEALLKIVSLIPFLKDRKDMRLLFVCLSLQIYIMELNNQTSSAAPLIQSLRNSMSEAGLEEYIPNIDALETWAAMYDGEYTKVTRWLKNDAPDEFSRFNMLDTFRYMVKIRAYIIQEKYLAVTSLATRLLPLLEAGYRHMDVCELHMLWAISDYLRKDEKSALIHIEKAVELAEKYRFDRLIGDEGKKVYDVLELYLNQGKDTPYLRRLLDIAKKVAMIYPNYLKTQLPEQPKLTENELYVLRLLSLGHSNAEMAAITKTSVDNIKFHCKKIYSKLEVSSRLQAVRRATELGILSSMDT